MSEIFAEDGMVRGLFLDIEADAPRYSGTTLFEVSDSGYIDQAYELDTKMPEPRDGMTEILIPGFCNAHSHLELTLLEGKIPPTNSFPEWAGQLFPLKMALLGGGLAEGVRQGIAKSLEAGVTAIGDIVSLPESAEALTRCPMRTVAFAELLCLPGHQEQERFNLFDEMVRVLQAGVRRRADTLLSVGVSPHAPHTVTPAALRRLRRKQAGAKHVTMHVAETTDEADFLLRGEGMFADFFRGVGLLPEGWQPPRQSPVQFFAAGEWLPKDEVVASRNAHTPSIYERVSGEYGVAHPPLVIFAHGNYLDAEDIAILKKRRVAVCWCPETHAYFGHRPWPLEQNRALPIVLGTDSLASAWSLSPLEQVRRALRARADWPATQALLAVTLRARDALFGCDPSSTAADFTVLSVPSECLSELAAAEAVEERDRALRVLLMDERTRPTGAIIGGHLAGAR